MISSSSTDWLPPCCTTDKASAAAIIAEQKERIRVLEIELVAVKASRDAFQAEANQMRKQIAMLNRKLKEAS